MTNRDDIQNVIINATNTEQAFLVRINLIEKGSAITVAVAEFADFMTAQVTKSV